MKKRVLYLLLAFGLFSCSSPDGNEDDIPEDFSFQPKVTVEDSRSHAMAFNESDTLKVGDVYRAKVFLANRHNVYNIKHTEPIIRYYHEKPIYLEEHEKGILVKPINDTAYVRFVVWDFEPKGERAITRSLHASITIPLQEGDTIFTLEFPYIVVRK